MMAKFLWKLAYTRRLRKLTLCGWMLAWHSAGVCWDDLEGDFDNNVYQYDPTDCAYEEATNWSD